MNNLLVATAVGSAVIAIVLAVVMTVLWLRERGGGRAGRAEEAARSAESKAATLEKELAAARARVTELERQVALDDFTTDNVFTLVAAGSTQEDGTERWYGLVRTEGGRVTPFLVPRSLAHIAIGDTFTSVRGQLVKLDASGLYGAPAPARGDEGSPVRDASDMDGASDDDTTETLLFSTPPPAAPTPAPAAPRTLHGPPAVDGRTVVRETSAPREDFERTVFMTAGGAAKPPSNPEAGLPYLSVTEGPDSGKRFNVPFSGVTIGRETHNAIALTDSGASRVHCRIDYEANRFVLRDNNSTNGTLCNDEPVSEQELSFGDVVHVADTQMRFTCEGWELRSSDPAGAVRAFEQTLAQEPDFVPALKNLAFLLEKDIRRKKEAQPLWDRLSRLER